MTLITASVVNLNKLLKDTPPLQGSDDLVFHVLEAGVHVHAADVGQVIVD